MGSHWRHATDRSSSRCLRLTRPAVRDVSSSRLQEYFAGSDTGRYGGYNLRQLTSGRDRLEALGTVCEAARAVRAQAAGPRAETLDQVAVVRVVAVRHVGDKVGAVCDRLSEAGGRRHGVRVVVATGGRALGAGELAQATDELAVVRVVTGSDIGNEVDTALHRHSEAGGCCHRTCVIVCAGCSAHPAGKRAQAANQIAVVRVVAARHVGGKVGAVCDRLSEAGSCRHGVRVIVFAGRWCRCSFLLHTLVRAEDGFLKGLRDFLRRQAVLPLVVQLW